MEQTDTTAGAAHYRVRSLQKSFPEEGVAQAASLVSKCNDAGDALGASRAWPSSRLSIAPMLEVTDRHFRYMMRLLSRRCLLYTEMLVDQTLLYNMEPREAQEYFLGHSGEEE